MLIEIPYRGRKWTTQEVQEFLHAALPAHQPGQPWGLEVQPIMVALGNAGAFGPDWIARHHSSPTPQFAYHTSPVREPRKQKPEPKPKAATPPKPIASQSPKPKPEPERDPIIELFRTQHRPKLRPKPPPRVSLWDVTPAQEATFVESAARALQGSAAETRSLLLAEEIRFQENLVRVARMRARQRIARTVDWDEISEDDFTHVVGWNNYKKKPRQRFDIDDEAA